MFSSRVNTGAGDSGTPRNVPVTDVRVSGVDFRIRPHRTEPYIAMPRRALSFAVVWEAGSASNTLATSNRRGAPICAVRDVGTPFCNRLGAISGQEHLFFSQRVDDMFGTSLKDEARMIGCGLVPRLVQAEATSPP